MGIELRISEIKNEKAKLAARLIDNGDGVLKEDEVSIFQKKATEMGVKARAINNVVDYFEKAKNSTDPIAEEKKTRKEKKAERLATAMEEVENTASNIKGEDGRYTEQVLKDTKAKMKEDGKLNKAERKALRAFEKTAVATDARDVILDAVMAQKNTEIEGTTGNTQTVSGKDVVTNEDLTKKRYVKKEAKADLKESGVWEDKAVREEWRNGKGKEFYSTKNRNFVSSISRIQAAQNDVEQSLIQSTEEVLDALETDKKYKLLEILHDKTVAKRDANGKPIEGETLKVAYKDENGNWHFDGLSQEIEQYLGADLELSRDAKKDRLVAEFNKIHGRLNLLTGEKLSKEEVRELVKLCGYDIEPKDWKKIVANTVTLGLAGAISGVLGSGGDKAVKLPDEILDLDNYFEISNLVDITVDTTITIPGETLVIPGNIGTAAALGIIAPAIIGLISGLQESGQKPVVPQNFSATNPQDLVDELKANKKTRPYADLYGTLAMAFRTQDENGNVTGWDREGFKDFLNKISGEQNCLLNAEEVYGAIMEVQRGNYKVQEAQPEDAVVNTNPTVSEEQTINVIGETPEVKKPIEFEWKREHNWHAIVAAYYPELANADMSKMKPAIDAFRKDHGISLNSGIPVGQMMQLKPITVNGVTYEPKQCTEEQLKDAINKFGWNCGFFSSSWNKKITHTAKLTITSHNDGGKTVYSGTLTDANGKVVKRVTGLDNADSAINNLRPSATNSDINLTINVTENGVTKTRKETIQKK